MADKSALDTQVGGGHYKDFPIPPVEFSLVNNLNAAQYSMLKYLVRDKADDDLAKAAHFAELWDAVDHKHYGLERTCLEKRWAWGLKTIRIADFVRENQLSDEIAEIMTLFLITPSRQRIAQAREKILVLGGGKT